MRLGQHFGWWVSNELTSCASCVHVLKQVGRKKCKDRMVDDVKAFEKPATNVRSMLGQCIRCWPSIEPTCGVQISQLSLCSLTALPADVGQEATTARASETESLPAASFLLALFFRHHAFRQSALCFQLKRQNNYKVRVTTSQIRLQFIWNHVQIELTSKQTNLCGRPTFKHV